MLRHSTEVATKADRRKFAESELVLEFGEKIAKEYQAKGKDEDEGRRVGRMVGLLNGHALACIGCPPLSDSTFAELDAIVCHLNDPKCWPSPETASMADRAAILMGLKFLKKATESISFLVSAFSLMEYVRDVESETDRPITALDEETAKKVLAEAKLRILMGALTGKIPGLETGETNAETE